MRERRRSQADREVEYFSAEECRETGLRFDLYKSGTGDASRCSLPQANLLNQKILDYLKKSD